MSRHATADRLRAWRDRAKINRRLSEDSSATSVAEVGMQSPEGMFVSASNSDYPEPMFKDLEVKFIKTTPFLKSRWYDWDKVKLNSFRGAGRSGGSTSEILHRKDAHEVEITHKPSKTHWTLSMRPKDFARFSILLSDPGHKDFKYKSVQKHLRRRCALSPSQTEMAKENKKARKDEEGDRPAEETDAEKEAEEPERYYTPTQYRKLPTPLQRSERRAEQLIEYLRNILQEVKEPWNILGTDWNAVEERRRGMVVCGFIELSRTSLIGTWEDGVKGKEGWAKKRRGGRKNDVFCFPDFLVPRTSQRRWLALRSNYLLYFYSPMDMTPQEVMLIDGYFQVLHKDTQRKEVDMRPKDEDPTGNREDRVNVRPGGRQHHAARNALVLRPFNKKTNEVWVKDKNKLAILNGFRDLLIDFHYEIGGRGRARVAREWALQLELRRERTTWFKDVQPKVGRYDGFAPVRKAQSANHVAWLVDGSSHFEQVYKAILSAEKEILIADWFITPEIFLLRAVDGVHPEHLGSRLDRLLFKKASEGVRIYILLYKEMNLPNASLHAKEDFMGRIKPHLYLDKQVEDPNGELELKTSNIVVLRHPNQGRGFIGPVLDTVMWAHHEKAAVIDRKIAFIGGIDLCVGRYDTAEHTLRDDVIYDDVGKVEHGGTMAGDIAPRQPTVGDDKKTEHGKHAMVDDPVPGLHPGHHEKSDEEQKRGNKLAQGAENLVDGISEMVSGSGSESRDDEKRSSSGGAVGRAPSADPTPTEKGLIDEIPGGTSHKVPRDPQDDPGTSSPTMLREPARGNLTELQGQGGDAPARGQEGVHSKPILNAFPGQDYSNPRIKDFIKLDENPCEDLIARDHTARMPWHDIGCTFRKPEGFEDVEGPVDDLVWHFIQRWNFAKWEKKKGDHVIPWLYPSQGLRKLSLEAATSSIPNGTVELQVLRSASQWSAGSPREKSINNAYLDLIRSAKHYIYIENQFFITKFSPPNSTVPSDYTGKKAGKDRPPQPKKNEHGQKLPISGVRIHNPIASAIVARVLKAHEQNETFKVYIIIPLFPAFHGDVTKGDSDPALPYVLSAQTECIRGLISELVRGGVPEEKVPDYVMFVGLRKWDILGKRLVTEQIYIHAKLLIIDDTHVLIGSANINDRSQMGSRDSELAILVHDTSPITTTMNASPYPHASSYAYTLRLRLFHEHLGVPFPRHLRDVHEPHTDPLKLELMEPRLADPTSRECWNLWSNRIDTNCQALRHVFQCVPDDTVKSWDDYHTFLQQRGGEEEEELERGMMDLAKEQGVPLTLRLPDLKVNLENNQIQQRDSNPDLREAVSDKNNDNSSNNNSNNNSNTSCTVVPAAHADDKEGVLALDILERHVKGHAVRFPVHFLENEKLNSLFKAAPAAAGAVSTTTRSDAVNAAAAAAVAGHQPYQPKRTSHQRRNSRSRSSISHFPPPPPPPPRNWNIYAPHHNPQKRHQYNLAIDGTSTTTTTTTTTTIPFRKINNNWWNTTNGKPTRLIAHRGERAFSLPEHTLPAYHLAIWEHADYVEPDLVLTKDGHLVIHHDLTLKGNTDIASHPEFAARMTRNATITDPTHNGGDLYITNDWFIADFTLAELRTLRLNVVPRGGDGDDDGDMRRPFFFNHMFGIPTFQEYLDLVRSDSSRRFVAARGGGVGVGVIPELKNVEWHNARFAGGGGGGGGDGKQLHYMEDTLLDVLHANGYLRRVRSSGPDDDTRYQIVELEKEQEEEEEEEDERNGGEMRDGHLAVQCAEANALKYLRSKTEGIYTVLLVFRNTEVLTPQGLDEAATFASALGIRKELYLITPHELFRTLFGQTVTTTASATTTGTLSPYTLARAHASGGFIPPGEISKEIKKRGMEQTPFTFYSSYEFGMVGADPGDTRVARRARELAYFMRLGVDSMFVENVAEAVLVREAFALCSSSGSSSSSRQSAHGGRDDSVCGGYRGWTMEEQRKELGATWMWERT
ncbi:Phospholipase D1 [Geranomyces michiganensis]|nr:Phospholipase D1 [Geranomyces michiganensis]